MRENCDDDLYGMEEAHIHIGDTVSFCSIDRTNFVNLDEDSNGVTWNAESESCFFTIYPAVGQPCPAREDSLAIHDGAVVCLFAPNGYFLSFDGERLAANRPYYVAGPSAEFIVHVAGGGALHNSGKVFLRNRASLRLLEVESKEHADMSDDDDDDMHLRSDANTQAPNIAEAQGFVIQKVFDKHVQMTSTPPRKRRSSLTKSRSRLVVPKLPKYARRLPQECAYMCKPLHKKLTLGSALAAATAVSMTVTV